MSETTTRRKFIQTGIALAGAGASAPGLLSEAAPAISHPSGEMAMIPAEPHSGLNRGIGVYPGDPAEYFGPALEADTSGRYRNLALRRAAYHSSSYDYNLTAQLVTDGIVDSSLPAWLEVETAFGGVLPKEEREFAFDHAPTSVTPLEGPRPWLQFKFGGAEPPAMDAMEVLFTVEAMGEPRELMLRISASDDGRNWRQLAETIDPRAISPAPYPEGFARPGQIFSPRLPLGTLSRARYYRVEFDAANIFRYQVGEIRCFDGARRVEVGGPYRFTSAWMPASSGEEWVYVDLGARCRFDKLILHWIQPAAEGAIQVSDDARSWQTLAPLPAPAVQQAIVLGKNVSGRYVRLLLTRPAAADGRYILSEMEVYGRGGLLARPAARPAPAGQELDLSGGDWRLLRAGDPRLTGETISQPAYSQSPEWREGGWLPATVPGTALAAYVNLGAVPEPNYGQNQLYISDTYFYSDFWYRSEFSAPALAEGDHLWLQFEGVNWKAEIYCNGHHLGRIEGGFQRGRFDLAPYLTASGANALAARIIKNDTPASVKQKTFLSAGKNGGGLGIDNPTFHASIGWDWIPTIRGRNTGLWNRVYLRRSGPVTVENPMLTTVLPDPARAVAEVTIEAEVVNHSAAAITGALEGQLGELRFSQPVQLAARARQWVRFSPRDFPGLRISQPRLWWPAGYGEPVLHRLELRFTPTGQNASDTRVLQAGLRQMTSSQEGGALRLWINGRRFIPRGGNWGFGEALLRYRGREYDTAVEFHRQMHFTMIRNWVGQIGEDAFYEACDRHGVMVWQDFWLANPWDGPIPKDDAMFLANARDTVLRIRHHASMGLYCGRNESFPPRPLEAGIEAILRELHPDLAYIPSSADVSVSGHGPYQAMPLEFYFTRGETRHLHSEMGMPNIPSPESVRAMMPAAGRWPQGLDWGLHDFCLAGAANGQAYLRMLENAYGGSAQLDEWIWLAQLIGYNGYRAMYEAQGAHRMGLLIWMSHCCWPSFVWQTYDYFFDCPAAYYGCRKASEPLHIQWNAASDMMEVINYSAGARPGLEARAEIFNLDGRRVWSGVAPLTSEEDSCVPTLRLPYPAGISSVHFLRLRLSQAGRLLSQNLYWRGLEPENYRALRDLPAARVTLRQSRRQAASVWRLTATLHNSSAAPALLTRLQAVGARDGRRLLPAFFDDNYVTLMPGESRTLHARLRAADARGQAPRLILDGWNVTTA